MQCNECQLVSINGLPCHEHGCPNANARYDREQGEWIRQRKCFDCGCTVDHDDPCCSAPCDEDCTPSFDDYTPILDDDEQGSVGFIGEVKGIRQI